MTNPYQPPADASSGFPRRSTADLDLLRTIARHQRNINLAILAQIGLTVVAGVFGQSLAVSLAYLVVGIATVVAEVLLVKALHGIVLAVVCAPLMFVPCLNLLTLLLFNQQATKRIRDAGYKVGLLGANPDDIR